MIRKLLAAVVMLAMCMGQGCPQAAPPPPPCLSIDDVVNIPAGSGVGTAFSGVYRAVSVVQDECRQCEKNIDPRTTCDPPTLDPTGRVTFSQTDGILTMSEPGKPPIAGGVDADGSFRLGTIATPTSTDGVQTGQGLLLMEGRFVGNRIIATTTVRLTSNVSSDLGGDQDSQSVNTVTLERIEE